MTEIQEKLLGIYKEFKAVCDANGLRYYADGGTRLGAIRHKGFIPWDDDMDIAMPIKDYNKFLKIASDILPTNIEIADGMKLKNVDFSFTRLADNTTTFIHWEDLPFTDQYRGVCIDIFPYIGVDSTDVNTRVNKRLDLISDELTNKKIYDSGNRPLADIKKEREELFNTYDIDTAKYVRSAAVSMWKYRAIFERKGFLEAINMPFEDTEIPVSIDYHNELTTQYGDYMKFPPVSQRVSHHFGFVDLDTPREVYKKEASQLFTSKVIAYTHQLQISVYRLEQQLIKNDEHNAEELKHKDYYISEAERKYAEVKEELSIIHRSRSWKILSRLRSIRKKLRV